MKLNIKGIPAQLKSLPNWLLWRAIPKDNGKIGKVPHYIKDNKPVGGGQNNLAVCMTFNTALHYADQLNFNGVGFTFDGNGIVGIDIDDCFIDGKFTDEAAKLINQFKDTYIEYSQSGKGIHIFIFDNDVKNGYRITDGQHRKGDYEIYEINRYFAITGNRVEGTGDIIKTFDGATKKFIADYIDVKPAQNSESDLIFDSSVDADYSNSRTENIITTKNKNLDNKTSSSTVLSDSALLNVMKNDNIFQSLFHGNTSNYGSHSEADIALMLKLAWLTNGDSFRMESLFSQSALARRDKWHRHDYRQRTIEAALKNWDGNYFKPKQQSADTYQVQTPADDKINQLKSELAKIKQNAPKTLTDEMVDDFLKSDFTDKETAEMFINVFGDFVKFNHDTDNWFIWNNNHWQELPVKSSRLLYPKWFKITERVRLQAKINLEIAKKNMQQSLKYTEKEKKAIISKFNETVKNTNYLESHKKIEATLKIAAGLPKVETYDKQYDADKFKLNLANKTINLKDNNITNNLPKDLITHVANVHYDPNAKCDEWDYFIKSAIPDDDTRTYVQKFAGYCLTGSTEEDVFFFLYGDGGSGKTTFVEAITAPFGDYAKTFPIELLTANFKENTGDEPCSQLYNMRRCRLAFTNETKKNRKFDTMKLKDWTGGGTLTARDLFKPPITFKPPFKILITGNFAPSIEDITDEGVKRRLRIIPFNHKPTKINTKLKEIFATENAKSAIFNWLLEGCKLYLQDKTNDINPFDIAHSPDEVKQALNIYYEANDNIMPFVSDKGLSFGNDKKTQVKDMWALYLLWCKENNEKSLKRNDFIEMFLRRLKDKNVTISKRSENKKQDMFMGIEIKESQNEMRNAKKAEEEIPPPTDDDYCAEYQREAKGESPFGE